jgi:hypothetical protein
MNIKSLLLGSAAALAAVSGAQAADAIVAAEPEAMEYVRVCDAFGTGYFYIPGTETCLKVGGYVRFEVAATGADTGGGFDPGGAGVNNRDPWDAYGRLQLDITAKSDTELGTLTSVGSIRYDYSLTNCVDAQWDGDGGRQTTTFVNEVYIQLGGFKVGRYFNWWDKGINGESDLNGHSTTTRMTSAAYTYTGGAFSLGVQLDELSHPNSNDLGVEALFTTKFGSVAFDLLGSYDVEAEEGAVRALISAPVGPGTLQALAIYSTGLGDATDGPGVSLQNAYYNRGEWALAASYAYKVTDKLTVTPGGTYIWNAQTNANGDFGGDDAWRAGLTVDYTIVPGFAAKVTANYNDTPGQDGKYFDGFVRLDRTF